MLCADDMMLYIENRKDKTNKKQKNKTVGTNELLTFKKQPEKKQKQTNKKPARWFFSKMGLFGNKELQFKTWGLIANQTQPRAAKDLGRAAVNEEFIGRNRKLKV